MDPNNPAAQAAYATQQMAPQGQVPNPAPGGVLNQQQGYPQAQQGFPQAQQGFPQAPQGFPQQFPQQYMAQNPQAFGAPMMPMGGAAPGMGMPPMQAPMVGMPGMGMPGMMMPGINLVSRPCSLFD